MKDYGFIRVAAASPKLQVANPEYNILQLEQLIRQADADECAVIVFPELSVTGYTCQDLFRQRFLLQQVLLALDHLLAATKETDILALVGAPLAVSDKIYNCAVAIQHGEIMGVVPQGYLPGHQEFDETRWFARANDYSVPQIPAVRIGVKKVPFGNLLFRSAAPDFTLAVEIGKGLWRPVPPSSWLAVSGANLIANLSAENELAGKAEYRRSLVLQQSARCICGYIYASAGVYESTTDLVFSGDCLIAENGRLLQASQRFSRENVLIECELDLEILRSERQSTTGFAIHSACCCEEREPVLVEIKFNKTYQPTHRTLSRPVPANPFIPEQPASLAERCEEIFQIQIAGLAKRMEHTGLKKLVLGVSGGLDSTLALLVAGKTCELLGLPAQNTIALTMPGFGTTDETHGNALDLMGALGVESLEIDIRTSCLQHFQDIGHDPGVHDCTYENAQARERTQILMDLANKHGGLVVGTGDLSELALGWCTFNGDHMSTYCVNGGIPKTLVRYMVRYVAEHLMTPRVRDILLRILNTPISPELLPPDSSGRMGQKTEEIIGPYELHDFFLFYTLRYGMEPAKVLLLTRKAFGDKYERETIVKYLTLFYHRFFRQQFKRSCMPDGPKVGSVGLSPRGDWLMPSDADAELWLKEMEKLRQGGEYCSQ
jgi:NAD+ synthase (glutamine-hydrolysing)